VATNGNAARANTQLVSLIYECKQTDFRNGYAGEKLRVRSISKV
jgi:hypothetical protein